MHQDNFKLARSQLASQRACALWAIGVSQIRQTVAKEVNLSLGDESTLEVTSTKNAGIVLLVIETICCFC
jgi:hypothetical protein